MDLVLQTLSRKRAEIVGATRKHEAAIAQAKHDLAHVNATTKILEGSGGNRAYIVSQGFIAKGDIAEMCQRHLADGPLNTRELAERVMCEKDLDPSDTPLRNSVVYKVVQALRYAKRRGAVQMVEKRKGVCVWALAHENQRPTLDVSRRTGDVPILPIADCRKDFGNAASQFQRASVGDRPIREGQRRPHSALGYRPPAPEAIVPMEPRPIMH